MMKFPLSIPISLSLYMGYRPQVMGETLYLPLHYSPGCNDSPLHCGLQDKMAPIFIPFFSIYICILGYSKGGASLHPRIYTDSLLHSPFIVFQAVTEGGVITSQNVTTPSFPPPSLAAAQDIYLLPPLLLVTPYIYFTMDQDKILQDILQSPKERAKDFTK